jgi:glyoxylase-like metal-dependent hydrolase (beta-lactamase superfamily II)
VTPATVAHPESQLRPKTIDHVWLRFFPGNQIYQPQQTAEAWQSDVFTVEGHECRIIEVGHSDTHDTTVLYVPDLRLVVAGDVVYGDVHQFFGEANTTAKRAEWLRALDTTESLDPHIVIARHKRPGGVDGVFNVQTTREYIMSFEGAVKETSGPMELYTKMQSLFLWRINPHAILAGAMAAFGQDAYEFGQKSSWI